MQRSAVCVTRLLLLALACGALPGPLVVPVWAQGRAWTKVPTIVVVTPEHDSRLTATHEAIDFWNRTLAELGTPFHLGPVTQTPDTIPVDYLTTLSAQVLNRTGFPDFPDSIQKLPGDLIVALSEGDFAVALKPRCEETRVLMGLYPLPATQPAWTRREPGGAHENPETIIRPTALDLST